MKLIQAPVAVRVAALLLCFLCCTANAFSFGAKDVCILGASASGMSSAAFLKDNGYSVVVIESQPVIGGHCNTVSFNVGGQSIAYDVGVQVFPDTEAISQANLYGLKYGPWKVSPRQFVSRFAGNDSVTGVSYSSLPAYYDQFSHNYSVGQSNCPASGDFNTALGTFFTIMARYPWLDSGDYPSTITDPDLLMPLASFVSKYSLQPLAPIIASECGAGGLGDWNTLSTIYCLRDLAPSILALTLDLNFAFAIKTGCISIYEGITKYIGAENVLTNATIISAIRGPGAVLIGTTSNNGDVSPFFYACGSVIVAFAQEGSKLGFMGLDWQESQVFNQVSTHPYYVSLFGYTPPSSPQPPAAWTVSQENCARPNHQISYPGVASAFSPGFGLPAATYYSSPTPLSDSQISSIVLGYANAIAQFVGFTNPYLIETFFHSGYAPFVSNTSMHSGFYGSLYALQGHRNTYYTGTLYRFAASHMVWDYSYRLVNQYWPALPKHGGGGGGWQTGVGIGGGVFGAAIVVGVVYRRRRRRNTPQQEQQQANGESTSPQAVVVEPAAMGGTELEQLSRVQSIYAASLPTDH